MDVDVFVTAGRMVMNACVYVNICLHLYVRAEGSVCVMINAYTSKYNIYMDVIDVQRAKKSFIMSGSWFCLLVPFRSRMMVTCVRLGRGG